MIGILNLVNNVVWASLLSYRMYHDLVRGGYGLGSWYFSAMLVLVGLMDESAGCCWSSR